MLKLEYVKLFIIAYFSVLEHNEDICLLNLHPSFLAKVRSLRNILNKIEPSIEP